MGKKMKAALEKVEPRLYQLQEAVDVVKKAAFAKFDESVDLAIRLGIDTPARSRQAIRPSRRCFAMPASSAPTPSKNCFTSAGSG